MTTALILIFIVAYALIIFEHPLKLDKTVPALLGGALVWAAISILSIPVFIENNTQTTIENALSHHLSSIAEILIFLIGAMVIVELIDLHRGFDVLTNRLKIRSKLQLLWLISILAFFLSAILDNLTCTIVMVSVLRRLISDKNDRWWFASMVVLAANSGGAWSPIGDVTTTMLWIGQKTSASQLIDYIFWPSVISLIVPLLFISQLKIFKGNNRFLKTEDFESNRTQYRTSISMLLAGMGGLIFVPIFKSLTGLPPYLGMLISMSFVWLLSEFFHPEENMHPEETQLFKAKHALSRIEFSSILFFLGILLSIGGLESTGLLEKLAEILSHVLINQNNVAIALGLLSAVIDNVPLVAAAMGMFQNPPDDSFWHLLAFTSGTGGSILIVGSAAGVAAMGLEQINFIWFLKKISWLALIGYSAGVAFYLLFEV